MADGCQCFEKGWTKHDGPCLYQQPARLGVRVWRGMKDHAPCYYGGGRMLKADEPGLWFATTPEAVAELRERLATAIGDDDRMYVPSSHLEVLADAVLRALGFQDAE